MFQSLIQNASPGLREARIWDSNCSSPHILHHPGAQSVHVAWALLYNTTPNRLLSTKEHQLPEALPFLVLGKNSYFLKCIQSNCFYPKSFSSVDDLLLLLLLCNLTDCNPPGSSVHDILQTRILEWFAMPSSKESSQPRGHTRVSCLLDHSATWDACGWFNKHLIYPKIVILIFVLTSPNNL